MRHATAQGPTPAWSQPAELATRQRSFPTFCAPSAEQVSGLWIFLAASIAIVILVALAQRLAACAARRLQRSPTYQSGLDRLGRLKRGLGAGSGGGRGRLARGNTLRRSLSTSRKGRAKMEAAAAEAAAAAKGAQGEAGRPGLGPILEKAGGEVAGEATWPAGVVPHEGLLLRALWPAGPPGGLMEQDAAELAELGAAGQAQHNNYA